MDEWLIFGCAYVTFGLITATLCAINLYGDDIFYVKNGVNILYKNKFIASSVIFYRSFILWPIIVILFLYQKIN